MVQSNVIVTYSPARQTAASEQLRTARRRSSRRVGVTLAGVLLAGGAAFTLGIFVRPDGSVREPGTSAPPQPEFAVAGRGALSPRIAPGLTVGGATPGTMDEAPPPPFLGVVRDVAPSPVAENSAVRPLSASVAREEVSEPRRVVLRAERGESPAPDQGVPPAANLASPPAPVPPTGQRRDLTGFLSEQDLALVAETDPDEALAPVSEWTPDDFAAPEDAPPSSAASEQLASIAEVAPARSEVSVGSGEALTQSATEAPAAEATQAPQLASAVPPVATTPVAMDAPASADQVVADPVGTTDAGADTHTRDAAPRLAVAATAPVQPPAAATSMPEAAYVQSYPVAVVNGEALGAVTLRDFGPAGVTIHLGALVGLLELRMPEAEFARLSSAAAAAEFVTLDQLRAAGIAVQLDAGRDRLLIDAR